MPDLPVRPDVLTNNLPPQTTSFIGREEDIAEVKTLLADTRLLTLTGSAGVGKTRLSLQAAADLLDSYADGVWLVELASLSDPALVPQTVASVLAVREQQGISLTETLAQALQEKQMLLVLDNCEHLVEACASLVSLLLSRCPSLRILATSREPLHVPGEALLRVPSLALPDPGHLLALEALSRYAAVRLFIERARAVSPGFAVTEANAPSIAQICHRLDGIPLAIELAAAQARTLSADQITKHLDDRFQLLIGGSRTARARQQTLRAAIDWSYDLLSEPEKRLLRRLSVFSGGWSREAAESICSGDGIEEGEIRDLLSGLVDKSLVVADAGEDGVVRYRLLEITRQYAAEQVAGSHTAGVEDILGKGIAAVDAIRDSSTHDDTADIRQRHASWFRAVAADAANSRQFSRVDAEKDNVHAALDYSIQRDKEQALDISVSLCPYWEQRGLLHEGRHWLEQVLTANVPQVSSGTPSVQQAQALSGHGKLCFVQGDFGRAAESLQAGLEMGRAIGDKRSIATALLYLGILASYQSDLDTADAFLRESLALQRELGDRSGTAAALLNWGIVAGCRDEYTVSRGRWEEAIALARDIGDKELLAYGLCYLGDNLVWLGDLDVSAPVFDEALAVSREIGLKFTICYALIGRARLACLQNRFAAACAELSDALRLSEEMGAEWARVFATEALACAASGRGSFSEAAQLWGVAEKLRETIGAPLPRAYRDIYVPFQTKTRESLGEAKFDTLRKQGGELSRPDAVELAYSVAEKLQIP